MTPPLRVVRFDAGQEPAPGRPGPTMLNGPVTFAGPDPRPLTDDAPLDLTGHTSVFGQRPRTAGRSAFDLLESLDRSGLSGRGGGHMAVARKWRAQLRHGGGGTVVMNAAESEPASGKDRALLLLRAHLALDGLECAAEAVGAREAVVWMHDGEPRVYRAVVDAVMERRNAGLGEIGIRVVRAAPHYLSGESSAIARALAGGPTLPQFRRAAGSPALIDGRPVLVHNVETLSRVALVARDNPALQAAANSTLLTVAHESFRTVIEVSPDALLHDVMRGVVGFDPTGEPQAALVGGYGGRWWRWAELDGATASEQSMRALGGSLGAGVLVPVAADECGLRQAAYIADYLALHSARQCGPCQFGLPATAQILADLIDGAARRADLRRLDRYLDEIRGRGGCHHPDGAVGMVRSALDTFADDVDAHRRGFCAHGSGPHVADLRGLTHRQVAGSVERGAR